MVKVKFTLDRQTDGQTDRVIPIYTPPQTSFAGGIKIYKDIRQSVYALPVWKRAHL